MSKKEEALEHFKAKVVDFSNMASDLLDAWEKLESADPYVGADMSEDYPFHKDFMELLSDIYTWKHTVLKKKNTRGVLDWEPPEE